MMELKELFCYRFQKWIEVSLKWLIHMYKKKDGPSSEKFEGD